MKKTKAIISPVLFGILLLFGNALIAHSAPHLEMSPLRVFVTLVVFTTGFGSLGLLFTRQYSFTSEGLVVYWYGVISRMYPWNKFLIHNVVYLKTSNATDGYYIVFSTKVRPIEKPHGTFMWPFTTFEIPYSEDLYNKLKTHCTALTNNSANDTMR